MLVCNPESESKDVLVATVNGYGKRTSLDEFPIRRRGGKGVIAIRTSERNGSLLDAALVSDDDDVMLMTFSGRLIRTPAAGISKVSRNTQGVRLIRLKEGDRLAKITTAPHIKEQQATPVSEPAAEMPVSYTHLTLPTKA